MSLAALDRFIDWFIPAELAGEREKRQCARMFVISHLFGPFIGSTIPIYLYIFGLDQGARGVILWASMLAFWVYNPVLRLIGRYTLLSLVSIQNLLFCVWWGWYFWGGISSPFLPWLVVVPILAFLYIGSDQKARMWMLGLIGLNIVAFFGLYQLRPPPPDVDLASLQTLGIVSTLAACVYVSMMALYYAKILASQVELESVMKGHLATAAELRRATAEAERAGAAKAEFLAKMSHELRTPLNAVIGYSQILLEDAADEGADEDAIDLEKIHSAGHHLLKLVNEVLDLSKIEAGKMELSPEETDAGSMLADTVAGFEEAARRGGNTLTFKADRPLGPIVIDVKKARQALGQILDNAAKFTHDGRIEVSARREAGSKGEEIVVRVRDTGVGISAEALPSLFDKFIVADDASSSKYGGTGLGLALSLKLCRLMGGDVSAESQVGAGSCFTLRFPVAPPAEPLATDAAAAAAAPLLTAAA
jgi:signal transduction histidine kinase